MTKTKMPKTLGACADELYNLRQERLKIQKMAAAIEEREKAIKEHIIKELPKSNASGVTGKVANVKVVQKTIPIIENFELFVKNAVKTKQFDLLSRSLSRSAVTERWDAKKKVPGVGEFESITVSVTKA